MCLIRYQIGQRIFLKFLGWLQTSFSKINAKKVTFMGAGSSETDHVTFFVKETMLPFL